MNFRTQIPLKKQTKNLINYQSDILLIGSCFSENIGDKLAYYKFQSEVNPTGILFHPKAIEKLIFDAVNKRKFTENDLFFNNERWHCFDAHSNLSSKNKIELLQNLNKAVSLTFSKLQNASHIVITLGTSWVYRFIKTDAVVANCHKIPQKNFFKEILSISEIYSSLKNINLFIREINKNALIIYTVSPVRHLKDGFIENQQSKAHLLSAIHQMQDINTTYFPSYEIMMDELRDYRFYKEDMIHPNTIAITYIWKKFCEVWLNPLAEKTMHEVETIQKGLAHKPFDENSKQHQQFLKNIEQKKKILLQQFSFMKF